MVLSYESNPALYEKNKQDRPDMKTSKTFLLSLAVIACLIQSAHLIASSNNSEEEEGAKVLRSAFGKRLPDAEGLITIQGQSKFMIEHIINARMVESESPLKDTNILHYNSETGFAIVGTVLNMSEEDRILITNNNYTYAPLYKKMKISGLHLEPEAIGAIIVGHQNALLGYELELSIAMANFQKTVALQELKKTICEMERHIYFFAPN